MKTNLSIRRVVSAAVHNRPNVAIARVSAGAPVRAGRAGAAGRGGTGGPHAQEVRWNRLNPNPRIQTVLVIKAPGRNKTLNDTLQVYQADDDWSRWRSSAAHTENSQNNRAIRNAIRAHNNWWAGGEMRRWREDGGTEGCQQLADPSLGPARRLSCASSPPRRLYHAHAPPEPQRRAPPDTRTAQRAAEPALPAT